MRIQNFFRQLILEYNSDNDTPTPDSAPPCDAPADQLRGGHIVSKWRRLEQFDPKSQEYLLLLTSILDDRADRKATTSLEGEDAAVVLDILARVRDHPPIWADYKAIPVSSVLIFSPAHRFLLVAET